MTNPNPNYSKTRKALLADPTYDPTGPGSPAWDTFDAAIEAKRAGLQKTYQNRRQYMILALKRDGNASQATINEWCDLLITRIYDPDWE
jgi:hypothetical protein